jgi:predicted ATPase
VLSQTSMRLMTLEAPFQQKFELTPRNAGAVAQLCARRDGMSLVVELAIGHAGTLGVEQMLERLNKTFQVSRVESGAPPQPWLQPEARRSAIRLAPPSRKTQRWPRSHEH